jgi:alpha-ketoglutarate-dependent taurine dioxygenase
MDGPEEPMKRDADFERFEVFPITGALGADLRGVKLTKADDATIQDVKRALDRYHVIAVRGQDLTPEGLRDVSRRFGPFSGNPVHQPLEGLEEIVRFVREPDDTGKVIGEDWHMDLAWLPKPPGITMLYGEEIPPVGGDTCFTSLELTYRMLTPRMRAILSGLVGVHSGKGVFSINAAHKGLTRAGASEVDEIETEHPVICVHPATGRRYVFVSSVLVRFKGMSEAESKPIIDYLKSCAVRPEFNCRLRWEPGTLAMWANPYVLHTAINDYASYRRVMYRTTIEGPDVQAAPPEAWASPESRAA